MGGGKGKTWVCRHLTRDDRIRIETLHAKGYSNSEIAQDIGVTRQTIWAELKRGMYEYLNYDLTTTWRYSCDKAQLDADIKASRKGKELSVGNDWDFVRYIERKIVYERYSPAGALGELYRNGNPFKTTICVRTLYNYIYKGLLPKVRLEDLPYKRKRKRRRIVRQRKKPIPESAASIECREDISDRQEFGHWEMDTVVGPAGKSKKALLVFTERKTRKELIRLLDDHTAASVVNALKRVRLDYKGMINTITCDNGIEFSDSEGIINSDPDRIIKLFFCHPYSAWERGSNENNNKLIRRWIPKGKSFDHLDHEDIQKIEDWINNYPRGIFQYKSAEMIWEEEVSKLQSGA